MRSNKWGPYLTGPMSLQERETVSAYLPSEDTVRSQEAKRAGPLILDFLASRKRISIVYVTWCHFVTAARTMQHIGFHAGFRSGLIEGHTGITRIQFFCLLSQLCSSVHCLSSLIGCPLGAIKQLHQPWPVSSQRSLLLGRGA